MGRMGREPARARCGAAATRGTLRCAARHRTAALTRAVAAAVAVAASAGACDRGGKSGLDLPVNPAHGPEDPPLLAPTPSPKLPASARLSFENAFGSPTFVDCSYATTADRDADPRDGVLEVEIVDAEDGSPLPFGSLSVRGVESGERLLLQAHGDGRVRIEGVPRIWLGLRVGEGLPGGFAARHVPGWRFVHGPGKVRVALQRMRWLRFRLDPAITEDGLFSVDAAWERQGAEGLRYGVATNGCHWNLGKDRPFAIGLPPGVHRVTVSFPFERSMPRFVLADVDTRITGEADLALATTPPIRGLVAWDGGTPAADSTVELEIRTRWGRYAVDATTIGRKGEVSSVDAGGSTALTSSNQAGTGTRDAWGGWRFTAPMYVSQIPVELIARARRDGEIVAIARLSGVAAGTTDAELVLRRPLEIHGRAVAQDGAPLAGQQVAATWLAEAMGPGSVLALATTGDDGSFTLRGLPDVPVRVTVGGQGYAMWTPEPWTGRPGEAKDVELRTAPTLRVRGTVTDRATGLPIGLDFQLQQETTSTVGYGFGGHADGKWWGTELVPGPARVAISFGGDWLAELPPVEITPGTCDVTLDLGGDPPK